MTTPCACKCDAQWPDEALCPLAEQQGEQIGSDYGCTRHGHGAAAYRKRLEHAADGRAVDVQCLIDARIRCWDDKLLPICHEADMAYQTLQLTDHNVSWFRSRLLAGYCPSSYHLCNVGYMGVRGLHHCLQTAGAPRLLLT